MMSEEAGSRVLRLTRAARGQSFPTVRPRDAATLMIIDRSGAVPKVLLGRRHHGHTFLPGAYVFPGGRVEAADRQMPAATPLDPRVESLLMQQVTRPSRHKARALALAAIRETFEETGLMVGRRQTLPPSAPAGLWSDFAAASVVPDLAALHFIARAITPPGRPKRYDTRFFAIDAREIAERRDGMVGPDSELTELVWVAVPEAAHLGLMTVTMVALEELQARIAAGMPRETPVPFYRMRNGRFVHSELG
jgi:8-oxo-dGTP pyrophosphatase MutT (NUDIX family)